MKYFIGVGEYRLDLSGCNSLKDKRQLIKSLTDRISRANGMAAGEVGDNDFWKSSTVAVTCLASSCNIAERALEKARQRIEGMGIEVVAHERWVFNPEDLIGQETCQGE